MKKHNAIVKQHNAIVKQNNAIVKQNNAIVKQNNAIVKQNNAIVKKYIIKSVNARDLLWTMKPEKGAHVINLRGRDIWRGSTLMEKWNKKRRLFEAEIGIQLCSRSGFDIFFGGFLEKRGLQREPSEPTSEADLVQQPP